MDERTYAAVYENINESNIHKLSKQFNIQKEVLLAILTQKRVRETRDRYYKIKAMSKSLLEEWKNGEDILKIAKRIDFPPVLLASMLLREIGFGKKETQKLVKAVTETKKNHSKIADDRLMAEIEKAVERDYIYSPWAHKEQIKKARIGEETLQKWLVSNGIEFFTEAEIQNKKTPDFTLKQPLTLNGRKIFWVESKAGFGDETEHKRYLERQYSHYLEIFGGGLVIYWYGFVDSIVSIEPRILIKDGAWIPRAF